MSAADGRGPSGLELRTVVFKYCIHLCSVGCSLAGYVPVVEAVAPTFFVGLWVWDTEAGRPHTASDFVEPSVHFFASDSNNMSIAFLALFGMHYACMLAQSIEVKSGLINNILLIYCILRLPYHNNNIAGQAIPFLVKIFLNYLNS